MAKINRHNMKIYPIWKADDKRPLTFFEIHRLFTTYQYGLSEAVAEIEKSVREGTVPYPAGISRWAAEHREALRYFRERAEEEMRIGHTGVKDAGYARGIFSVRPVMDKLGKFWENMKMRGRVITNYWIPAVIGTIALLGGVIAFQYIYGAVSGVDFNIVQSYPDLIVNQLSTITGPGSLGIFLLKTFFQLFVATYVIKVLVIYGFTIFKMMLGKSAAGKIRTKTFTITALIKNDVVLPLMLHGLVWWGMHI